MDLSIIFVNWNSVDYLRECIASVYEFTRGIPLEIIVVDNASPEGGVEILKYQFPDITLIMSAENLGFSRANNLGFQHSSGMYVMFLNPDTKLISPAINIMLEHLKSLPDAGVVGCKLLNSDSSVQTSCIQKFPRILNQVLDAEHLRLRWPACRLWEIDPLFADNAKPTSVEVISGACMMLKRQVFERVGGFSEEYFMYADDLDLCYKTKILGLNNYYTGDATVIHHGGKSTNRRSASQWATVMKLKSVMQFCVKSRGPLYGAMYRVAMVGTALGRLLILAALVPFGNLFLDRETLQAAFSKWSAVLKWAAGLERWAMVDR